MLIASGGLNSTTLACLLKAREVPQLTLLGVGHGQRHCVELSYLKRTAAKLGAWYAQLDVPGLGRLMAGSALTGPQVPAPSGRCTDDAKRAIVVPSRNAPLLDLAVGLAISARADAVVFGAHVGDHPINPDCRPAFMDAHARMAAVANKGFLPEGFQVVAPFLTWSKAEIVQTAAELGVPFGDTWSCHRGGTRHCGRRGACTERKEAFALTGVADPTDYQDVSSGLITGLLCDVRRNPWG